jgi:hypothetical protein
MLESGIAKGRIVHYFEFGICHAGIIVDCGRDFGENAVNVKFWACNGADNFEKNIIYANPSTERSWHWPLDHKVD